MRTGPNGVRKGTRREGREEVGTASKAACQGPHQGGWAVSHHRDSHSSARAAPKKTNTVEHLFNKGVLGIRPSTLGTICVARAAPAARAPKARPRIEDKPRRVDARPTRRRCIRPRSSEEALARLRAGPRGRPRAPRCCAASLSSNNAAASGWLAPRCDHATHVEGASGTRGLQMAVPKHTGGEVGAMRVISPPAKIRGTTSARFPSAEAHKYVPACDVTPRFVFLSYLHAFANFAQSPSWQTTQLVIKPLKNRKKAGGGEGGVRNASW